MVAIEYLHVRIESQPWPVTALTVDPGERAPRQTESVQIGLKKVTGLFFWQAS